MIRIDFELLTEKQKVVLQMKLEGMTAPEIASKLKLSTGSVKAMLTRAKKTLEGYGDK